MHLGGFQLVDLIITDLKDHMTCYKFKCSHWWKSLFVKKILYSSQNFVISTNERNGILTDRVICKLCYNEIYQMKTTDDPWFEFFLILESKTFSLVLELDMWRNRSTVLLNSDLRYNLEATGHIFLVWGPNLNLIENCICFGNQDTTLKEIRSQKWTRLQLFFWHLD